MGIRLSNTTDVIFQDVHVPAENIIGKEGDGFKIVMKALEKSRPICVAPLIGTAQKALEIAAQYTRERCPYGKPIGKLQGIQFKIADMEIASDSQSYDDVCSKGR
ncbi:MAG: acyl-CoA dehydrogenase family protein [Clostridium sp.]